MNILSWNSFTSNPHGEGYLSLNGKFEFKKSENKLIFKTPSYFLATHQRFATSGLKDENGSHPHFSDGLYVLHNGIIYGKGNEKESDTEIFTKELGEEYKKNGGNCVEAIKTICKKTSGSFSILVYEEKTEKMYYFKDGSTKMFIVESEEWMVMSTSESNVIYAKTYLGIEDKVREFRDMELYDIFQDKYITKLEKDYTFYNSNKNSFLDYFCLDEKKKKGKKNKKDCVVCLTGGSYKVKCSHCKKYFHEFCADKVVYRGRNYCIDCIRFGFVVVSCKKCNKKLIKDDFDRLFDYMITSGVIDYDFTEAECLECVFSEYQTTE